MRGMSSRCASFWTSEVQECTTARGAPGSSNVAPVRGVASAVAGHSHEGAATLKVEKTDAVGSLRGLAMRVSWLFGVLIWALPAMVGAQTYSSGVNGISATANNSLTQFINNHSGGDDAAFSATWVTVRVRSAGDACFYDLDGTASTADTRVEADQFVNVKFVPTPANSIGWTAIGIICDAGESATWDVTAARVEQSVAMTASVTGATGTEYVVNAAAPANPTGPTLTAERDDQLAALAEAEGDWTNARATAKGAIWVALPDAAGDPITSFGGGTEYTEDVATANPQVGKAIMVERDDALAAVAPAEADWIGLRGSAEGALWTQDFNSDAILADTTAILADTAAIETAVELIDNLVHLEDDASANLDPGLLAFARRTAAPADTSGADLDYEVLQMDNGRLWTTATIDVFPDNEPFNMAQVSGTAVTVNAGNVDAGTQRVVLASDQAVVSIDDNASAVTIDWAGTAPPIGGGAEATALLVTVANDSTGVVSVDDGGGTLTVDNAGLTEVAAALGATAAAVPSSAVYVGGTDGTNLTGFYVDPCQREARTVFPVDIVTATTTEIANAVAGEFFYICSINLVAGGATNVAIVEDDTDACATPTAGLNGGVTAAEGWNFAANGGLTQGNGLGWVMKTGTANRYLCFITSAAEQLSGTITYVSAP